MTVCVIMFAGFCSCCNCGERYGAIKARMAMTARKEGRCKWSPLNQGFPTTKYRYSQAPFTFD